MKTDLIARLEALEKEATPGPWTSCDEKRGAKKSIWRADTAREVSEAEWGPQFADRPSRYGPYREDVANCFSKETAALIVELRNNLHAILRAMKVTKAAEAYVSENPPLFLQLDSEMYYECCHCQSTARSENDVRHRDECPWVALAAAVKGEQG